jgi:putative transposase
MKSVKELNKFIAANPDARELKRALAVKLAITGYMQKEIGEMLNISQNFVSKWKKVFIDQGISGLQLAYQGAKGKLGQEEKAEVVNWLKEGNEWNLWKLESYIENKYGVKFKSKQSYYALFEEAGISWKKVQKYNPKKDPEKVTAKQEEIKKTKKVGSRNKGRKN